MRRHPSHSTYELLHKVTTHRYLSGLEIPASPSCAIPWLRRHGSSSQSSSSTIPKPSTCSVVTAPHQGHVNGRSSIGRSQSSRLPRANSSRSGSLAGLRLCMVMHVGSSGGSRASQGPAGPPARLGNRPIPVNGCPQRIGERITYSRPVADCTQPGGREIRTDADSTPLTGLSRACEDQPRNGLKPECRLVVRASMSQGLCRSMSAQECLSSASGSWWWGPWSAMGWARELGWSLGWERGLGWWSSGWESLSSSSRAWAPVSAVWGSC